MFFSSLFSSRPELQGRWIEGGSATRGAPFGFVLSRGGAAHSINAASAQYTAWRRIGDSLTLWGRVRRGADTMEFIESLRIHELTHDKLVLGRADESFEFRRE